jgi:hypothetical protein|tara:strand:- start:2296 stop:2781 length:486 start_codon:yes stop_codon:yes gene_type:complete
MSDKSKMGTETSTPKLSYYVGKAKKKVKDLYNKIKDNLDEPMFKTGLDSQMNIAKANKYGTFKKGGRVKKRDPKLVRAGVSGYNKPKRTPKHPKKSHVVVAKMGDKTKLIRFGQQGVRGAGKNPKSKKDKARKKSYYARHNAQDARPNKFSARYWSHKVKW